MYVRLLTFGWALPGECVGDVGAGRMVYGLVASVDVLPLPDAAVVGGKKREAAAPRRYTVVLLR